jgi:hypothetical protein
MENSDIGDKSKKDTWINRTAAAAFSVHYGQMPGVGHAPSLCHAAWDRMGDVQKESWREGLMYINPLDCSADNRG